MSVTKDNSDQPPSYNEAISSPLYIPSPDVQHKKASQDHRVQILSEVNNVRQDGKLSDEFTDMAQLVSCWSCFRQVTTEVTTEASPSGWAFAIICCLCGSWVLSCLVYCFPGFRRFTHTCPSCGAIIAQTEPKHSMCQLATIILMSIGVIILLTLYLMLKL